MARLPQGVRRRKDGTLEKRFTVNKVRYSVYAGNTKELAVKEQELRNQIKAGAYKKNRSITLDKYFGEWIERRKRTVKSNTIYIYTTCYNTNIKSYLGSKRIVDIERREIIELQGVLSEKLSPTSTNYMITLLNIIFNDAITDEIITRNPARKIKGVKEDKKANESYHRALTKQEQADFMQALKGSYYYTFIAFMLSTGMRVGEVGALTWQDIDYKNNVIHVNKTITKNENGNNIKGDSTKTDAGERDIPLNDTIKGILLEHKKTSDILPFLTNNIFTSTRGNIIHCEHINKEIKRVLRELDQAGKHIEPFTSHALRDTFATRYIEQGGSMQTLKTILGHSSITMTMDLYAHVLPDTKQAEMDKIKICI